MTKTKPLFNEVETYLIDNWTDVRLVERSLGAMRQKYEVVMNKVIGLVRKKYPELDNDGKVLDIDEDDDEQRDIITVGVGRKTWPSESIRGQPSGLWLSGISLGELIVEHEKAPCANVFLWPRKDSKLDLADVENRLEKEARRLLPEVEVKKEGLPKSACIFWAMPESREDLLQLLLKDEGRPFINCLARHFDTLAKFILVVDKIFQQGKASPK